MRDDVRENGNDRDIVKHSQVGNKNLWSLEEDCVPYR